MSTHTPSSALIDALEERQIEYEFFRTPGR